MTGRQRTVQWVAAMLLACGCLVAGASDNHVRNGDFEHSATGKVSQWQTSGSVELQQASGKWHTFTCEFDTANYTEAAFYFGVEEGAIGSIWIDNIHSTDVAVVNGSFEDEAFDSGEFGWNPSNRGDTIFLDPSRASDGKHSIRVTHVNEAVKTSRIHRKFPVTPRGKFTLQFDVFVGDDFQGEAKGLIFSGGMNDCILTNWGGPFASRLVELRDRCGAGLIHLTSTAGAPLAGVLQELQVPPGRNLQAGADVDRDAFEGVVKLIVEDAASGKSLCETVATADEKVGWVDLCTPFRSPASGKLRIRVIGEGAGTAAVDNISITDPQVVPPLQSVTWSPAGDNFRVPAGELTYWIDGESGTALAGALGLLAKDLETHGRTLRKVDSADNAALKLSIAPSHAIADRGDESYKLVTDSSGISIRASAEAGAFYGLMTLLQLVQASATGDELAVLACDITDFPDMPMRGVLYADPEQAARWKMNTLMYSTGTPVRGEPGREEIDQVVQICAKLNLDFIPYFISMYAGHYVQQRNPSLAAGNWVKDEKLTMNGTEPAELAHRRVIRTKLSDVVLTSTDGKTKYVLGKDYAVIDGDMEHPYDQADPRAFAVARTHDSSIPDGATVLASYDYVDLAQTHTKIHVAYCPLEPETMRLMHDYVRDLASEYPFTYLHPAHCLYEFAHPLAELGRDSRVIKSGKTPIALLVEDVNAIDRALKAGNPHARILQWAGPLNDESRFVAPLLPKDAHVQIWGYDTSWPSIYGRDSIFFWSERGFETSVMSWVDIRNIRGWAQVVAEARAKGYPCMGMINACWPQAPNPAAGMKESAIVSWKLPKKGEPRYVELTR